MLVDTHCHLFFEHYDADRREVLERARAEGVCAMINVGIDGPSTEAAIRLAAQERDVYATVGLHPHSAHLAGGAVFNRLEELAREPRVVAVGEVGLDYFKSEAPKDVQRKVFLSMARLAAKANL